MPPLTNRLDAPWLDAALHLLDRQVVDVDGKMVCNVDDLELIEGAGGGEAVHGSRGGGGAVGPRAGGVGRRAASRKPRRTGGASARR